MGRRCGNAEGGSEDQDLGMLTFSRVYTRLRLMPVHKPHMLHTFEDTWNEAIEQLLQWGGVFVGEDETYVTGCVLFSQL
jgi:hypothetical protein